MNLQESSGTKESIRTTKAEHSISNIRLPQDPGYKAGEKEINTDLSAENVNHSTED